MARERGAGVFVCYLVFVFSIQVALWTVPCVSEGLGGNCTDSDNCNSTVGNSTCTAESVCECEGTHYPSANNTTCLDRVSVGQSCTGSGQGNCVTDATCDNGTCRVPVGQSCSGSGNCVTDATCDSGICRAQSGQSCSSGGSSCPATTTCDNGNCVCDNDYYANTNNLCLPRVAVGQSCIGGAQCVTGAVCDSDVCRLEVQQPCTGNDQCQSGSQCVNIPPTQNNQCRITAGNGDCGGVNDNCVPSATCESTVCRTKVGQSCTGSGQGNCVTDATCDSNVCKIPAGSNLDCNNNNDNCVSSAVCDTGNRCRVPLGGDCSGNNQGNCVTGATCDSNVCRKEVGQSCSVSGDCVTGATCDSNVCRLRVLQPCTQSPDYCQNGSRCEDVGGTPPYQCRITAGSDLNCNNNASNCVMSALCETNKCKTRVTKVCPANFAYCQANSQCVSVAGGGHQCRWNYGHNCGQSGECDQLKNEECLSYSGSGNSKKCLCKADHYRSTGDNCRNVNLLTVGSLSQDLPEQETRVRVTWTRPSDVNLADYRAAKDNPPSSGSWTSSLFHEFTGQTPGTQFTVHVAARTLKDPDHDPQTRVENDNAGNMEVKTKPAMPGKLKPGDHKVPTVTLEFNASIGHVDNYRVTLKLNTQLVGGPQTPTMPSATFSGLTVAETNYSVTIQAVSNNVYSDEQTDTVYVDAAGAESVSDLRVVGKGGRWVEVSWKKPGTVNGDMWGYTARVRKERDGLHSCVSGLALTCSDCPGNPTSSPDVSECMTTSSMTMTRAELENATTVLTHNLTDLQPDVNYTVRVNAYNQKGRGKDTDVPPFFTDREAALTLNSMTVTPAGEGQLNVTWEPRERTGPTIYTVSWRERQNLTSDVFVPKDTINISGYEVRSHLLTGLLNYWDYEVSVFPFTEVSEPKANVTSRTQTTTATAPGLVTFTLTQSPDSAESLQLTAQCPGERDRNGPITSIFFTANTIVTGAYTTDDPSGIVEVSGNCEFGPYDFSVVAEASYNVTVFAKTPTHDGTPSFKTITIQARPPKLAPPSGASSVLEAGTSSVSQVDVGVCGTCVLSPLQGSVPKAGINLCAPSPNTPCSPASGVQNSSKYDQMSTWKQARDAGWKGTTYRATSDDFPARISQGSRRRRSAAVGHQSLTSDFVTFTLGEDSGCSSQDSSVFCNGPLPPDTQFMVIVWACTSAGCTETEGATIRTVAEDESNVGLIVGILMALVAIAVVAAVVAVVFLRRKEKMCFAPKSTTTTVNGGSLTPLRRTVPLRDFISHLERLHKDSNLLFQEEYEEIQEKSPKHYPQEAALLDANKVKNRYVNILPFDYTRVKLSTDDDDETSDFINANYIPGYTSPREYIATQGPMACTLGDFWRMVWEQKSTLIVMLSDLEEKGRPKVDCYWPRETHTPTTYGDIVVEMTDSRQPPSCTYTIRTFSVFKEGQEGEVRQVSQYFIPEWQDFSANLKPDDMLDFIAATRRAAATCPGPVIVHCSAGVGRTGTFVALDFLMQFVQGHSLDEEVDIYNLVLNMRHNRPHMVQTEKQYVFIHDTLKVIIERKMAEDHVYGNTVSTEDIYVNQAFVPEEENLYENTDFKPTTVM